MIDLTQVREKGAVLPEALDKRIGMALSNGVVKEDFANKKNLFEYEQNLNTTPLKINQKFFEKRIAEERLMLSKDQKNIKLLKRVGDVYLANKKPDKAKNYYNKAFMLNTDDLQTASKLAGVFMILSKPEKANQVLDMLTAKEDSEILHLHAIAKMAVGDLDGSIKLLDKIQSDAKNYYEAVNTKGLINLIKDDPKDAEKCFILSIKANSNYSPAKNNLAVSYFSQNKVEKAMNQYRKVIDEDSNYVLSFNNLFSILADQDEIAEAYKLMLSAKHLANANNEIQFRTAWCEMRLGKYAEAIKSFEKVLDILPNNSNTLNNIGYCYENLHEVQRAIEYFLLATKGNNVTLYPYRNLMVTYDTVGEFEKSRKYARIVLDNNPKDIQAMVLYGNGLVESEQWDGALKYLLEAYKEKPNLASLYVSLAYIYADIYPDFEKGIEAVNIVLNRKMPKYEEIYNNYMHLLLVNNKVEEANKLVKHLNPNHPVSLATLALLQLKQDNVDESKALFKRAIKLANSKFKDKIIQREYYDLAVYYRDKKDFNTAKKYFKSVVGLGDKGFKNLLTSAKLALEDN